LEEQKFIEALRGRNQQAYGRSLDEYRQKVFSTCISLLPNKEDAEDIAQKKCL
jgi:RNA polymerase sigma-70 factor (ECF subfamily)